MIESQKLVLFCLVAEGTGNTTFIWYKETTWTSLGRKTQSSLCAELEISAQMEMEGDAGEYYCKADSGHDPSRVRW